MVDWDSINYLSSNLDVYPTFLYQPLGFSFIKKPLVLSFFKTNGRLIQHKKQKRNHSHFQH